MYIFAVFELSTMVEDSVAKLIDTGLNNDSIFITPLEEMNESKTMFDTVHYSDNASTLTFGFILAMIGMLTGIVYGFRLYWGPILWAFILTIIGMAVGLIINIIVVYFKKRPRKLFKKPLVIVIIQCERGRRETIYQILRNNSVLGISEVDRTESLSTT